MLDLDMVASVVNNPTVIIVTLVCGWVLSERALRLLLIPEDHKNAWRTLGLFLIFFFFRGWGQQEESEVKRGCTFYLEM